MGVGKGGTYEEPDTRVVGLEAQHDKPVWTDEDCVAAHGRLGEGRVRAVVCVEEACFLF